MANKSDAANLEWFGADYEQSKGGKRTSVVLEGVTTKRGSPVMAKTTGRDDRIAELTARYKTLRSAADVAPLDDRSTWEKRRDIAFAEMQLERFAQQLEKYRKRSDARPEQVEHYQQRIDAMRGRWLRLTGQD